MSLNAPDWLTARPIAHRGLHDVSRGVVENTLGAAAAAVAAGYAIECDVQPSRDGVAMVFHDATLRRLCRARGALIGKTAAEIQKAQLRASAERIPTFAQLLALIAGRTPIICELKSRFDGDFRIADAVAPLAETYDGPLAFKSFDPDLIAYVRERFPGLGRPGRPCPVGMVAEARYGLAYYRALNSERRRECAEFLHYPRTRPDFLSWHVDDLPAATPFLLRALARTPVMAWTVRRPEQRALAARWADQIVFEGAGQP